VFWKAPGFPGYDPDDPIDDYAWGALVPFIMVVILVLVITIV
jgi:hypothetical protein